MQVIMLLALVTVCFQLTFSYFMCDTDYALSLISALKRPRVEMVNTVETPDAVALES